MKVPVDEAPAGPALDAAVAMALGYEVEWSPQPDGRKVPIYLVGTIIDLGTERPHWTIVPNYSIEIAAAWGLVNVMREKGFVLYSLDESTGRIFERWCARFVTSDDPAGLPWEAGWHGYGVTAPLAICRAFLKANSATHVEIPDGT